MKETYPFHTKMGGLGIALFLRSLMKSVDVKLIHHDRSADPSLPEFRGRVLFSMWHEYITFPIPLWRHYDLALLASKHKDADWLIRAAHHLGFDAVRGSTNRGGSEAIRQLKKKVENQSVVITPDGPRGPRREMSMGPVYLASRLGLSIVPVGLAFDRPLRLKTWDRFAIPRPGSRGRAIFGPCIEIPRRTRREGLEQYRLSLQAMMDELNEQAEEWAVSGKRLAGESNFERIRKRFDPPIGKQEAKKSVRIHSQIDPPSVIARLPDAGSLSMHRQAS